MRKNGSLPFSLVACALTVLGCEGLLYPTSPGSAGMGDDTVYFNSFESPADTAGWRGYGMLKLEGDAPAAGGRRSAYVSGGCPYPHSFYEFTAAEDGPFILRVWGKDLGIGGGVALEQVGTEQLIHVSVTEPDWTFYQSQDTLLAHKGEKLRLSMGAGGIVASAMLVDLIEVARAEQE